MKLVVRVKLVTDEATDRLLQQTTEQYRRACCHLSQLAFATRTFARYELHRLAYYTTREQFGLPAQLVIRAIAEVASAYKSQFALLKKHNRSCRQEERRELTPVEFAQNLAVPFDQRLLSYGAEDQLSLRLLEGRVCLRFQVGEKRQHLIPCPKGQADLKRSGKDWYLLQTVEVQEAEPVETSHFVGVDCGLCTIASSHDGSKTTRFPGHRVRKVRQHFSQLRRGLQRHNTKSSRRRVRLLRNRESRIVRTENHLISRRIVMQAQRTMAMIVLENLEDIRARTRVSRSQRYERLSWSYFQLQQMIVYKARLAGIPVLFVAPAYTSQTCSRCWYCAKANRREQAWFVCQDCGHACHANDNAAVNIRFLGGESTARKRTVSMEEFCHRDRRKPPASAGGS